MGDDQERLNRVLDDLAAERDPRDRLLLSPDEAKLAELAALLKAARDEPATPDASFVEALAARIAGPGAAGDPPVVEQDSGKARRGLLGRIAAAGGGAVPRSETDKVVAATAYRDGHAAGYEQAATERLTEPMVPPDRGSWRATGHNVAALAPAPVGCVTEIWKIHDGTDTIPGGEAMDKVMIVLDGSGADARIVELAGALLAGKNVEVTLLHVVPGLPRDERGWDDAVVLEGYVAAERCDVVMAPLIERLHAGFTPARQNSWSEPRLAPRHLLHHDDARGVIERCGIAQQRRDSLDLLAASAERLRHCGIDAARVTRDSAIGNPADIVRTTTMYLGVDLVIVGDNIASQGRHSADDSGWDRVMADMPCPVLVVPVADDAAPREEPRAATPSRVAPA